MSISSALHCKVTTIPCHASPNCSSFLCGAIQPNKGCKVRGMSVYM